MLSIIADKLRLRYYLARHATALPVHFCSIFRVVLFSGAGQLCGLVGFVVVAVCASLFY
jgi:hypothetical protein